MKLKGTGYLCVIDGIGLSWDGKRRKKEPRAELEGGQGFRTGGKETGRESGPEGGRPGETI